MEFQDGVVQKVLRQEKAHKQKPFGLVGLGTSPGLSQGETRRNPGDEGRQKEFMCPFRSLGSGLW